MSKIIIVSTTMSENGTRTLVLDVPRPETLSSNVQVFHYTKAKLIKQLRETAVEVGVKSHAEDSIEAVKKRIKALDVRNDWQTKKSALSKKLKKQGKTKDEIDAHLEEVIGDNASYEAVNAIEVPFLYTKARVRVLIGNTVKRDFDPPNFWPTVKAITDGLTDCAWWEDDNFNYLTEVSFAYGERSDTKGCYRFQIIIEPVLSDELPA